MFSFFEGEARLLIIAPVLELSSRSFVACDSRNARGTSAVMIELQGEIQERGVGFALQVEKIYPGAAESGERAAKEVLAKVGWRS